MSEPTTSTDASSSGPEPSGPDRVSTRPGRESTGHDDGAEVTRSRSGPRPDDAYCGNCSEFSYVRTDDGLAPYCGLHEEVMDDMDACSEWRPNTD